MLQHNLEYNVRYCRGCYATEFFLVGSSLPLDRELSMNWFWNWIGSHLWPV